MEARLSSMQLYLRHLGTFVHVGMPLGLCPGKFCFLQILPAPQFLPSDSLSVEAKFATSSGHATCFSCQHMRGQQCTKAFCCPISNQNEGTSLPDARRRSCAELRNLLTATGNMCGRRRFCSTARQCPRYFFQKVPHRKHHRQTEAPFAKLLVVLQQSCNLCCACEGWIS